MIDPILTDRGMVYKRNVLLICAVASLSLLEGVDISTAKIFDVQVGNNLWTVGGLLFLYHLSMYLLEMKIGWIKWNNQGENDADNLNYRLIFGMYNKSKPSRPDDSYSLRKIIKKENGQVYASFYSFDVNHNGSTNTSNDHHIRQGIQIIETMKTQFIQFFIFDCLLVATGVIFSIYAYNQASSTILKELSSYSL